MRVCLVPITFAAAASAAALPGVTHKGSCFKINGFPEKSFGSFYYHRAGGTVTNEQGSNCGWGSSGHKFSCGEQTTENNKWILKDDGYVTWPGHKNGYFACYDKAIVDAEIYLFPQEGKKCEKVYAKKCPCPKPPQQPCDHPKPRPHPHRNPFEIKPPGKSSGYPPPPTYKPGAYPTLGLSRRTTPHPPISPSPDHDYTPPRPYNEPNRCTKCRPPHVTRPCIKCPPLDTPKLPNPCLECLPPQPKPCANKPDTPCGKKPGHDIWNHDPAEKPDYEQNSGHLETDFQPIELPKNDSNAGQVEPDHQTTDDSTSSQSEAESATDDKQD